MATTEERRHPTILDVAVRAGVSKSTVSNVVRAVPGVSEATRRRVLDAIEELGYRPNVLARQLVQRRTSILGVVVGDLANPFFAEMAKSLERHAAAHGYTAMFCNTEGDSESELAGVETLLQHRVAGIVFLTFSGDSRTMDVVLARGVPVVFISCGAEWADVVSVDDALGGRIATQHLLDAGHRRIAYLSIPELEDESDRLRCQGCSAAVSGAGLAPPVVISWSPSSDHALIDRVEGSLRDVFSGAQRVTGVFASNDVAAIALQEFADRVGLHVPNDLSIVGFDDVPMAGLARIALTTVAQPRDELARLGIARIAGRIEGKVDGPPSRSHVDVQLIERGSTAPPARPASIVENPNELAVVTTREFDAPRELVFDVLTKPEHVRHWFAPGTDVVTKCDIDMRVDGGYHIVFVTSNGTECSFRGTYMEVVAPSRTVATWHFDGWPDVDAVETVDLHESEGTTRVITTLAFHDMAGRAHLQRTQEQEDSFDKFADYLRSILVKEKAVIR